MYSATPIGTYASKIVQSGGAAADLRPDFTDHSVREASEPSYMRVRLCEASSCCLVFCSLSEFTLGSEVIES